MSDESFARWARRVRRSAAWAGVAAWFFLGAPPVAAQPCPCPTFDVAAIVQQAGVIFVGRALSATTESTRSMRDSNGGWIGANDSQMTRLLFDVQTVIKGAPPRFVEVVTPLNLCGASFAVGETYLVVGNEAGAAVITDACKGNISGSDAINTRVEAIRNALEARPMPRETREPR